MAVVPYLRIPSWKPAHALRRIAEKVEAYRNRLGEIAVEEAALAAERLDIEANLQVLEVERGRESERVRLLPSPLVADVLPLDEGGVEADPSEVVPPVAERDEVDYDPALRVFRSPRASRADPRSAKAVIPAADDADPGLGRLLRLVSIPGAMHVSLVGEAAQRQFGDAFAVPPAACSVPLGPFFMDDTLSMSVLQDLVKPEKAGPVLTALLGEASLRGGAAGPDPTGLPRQPSIG